MRRRVKVIFSEARGFYVDLPTYSMVPGSWEPVITNKTTGDGVLTGTKLTTAELASLTVEVDHPDEYASTNSGRINLTALRTMYKNHVTYGKRTYTPDINPAGVDHLEP